MRYLLIGAVASLAACTQPDSGATNNEVADPASVVNADNQGRAEPLPIAPSGNASEADTNRSAGPARPLPDEGGDQCGASKYQYLVDRPRSEIPAQPDGATWRVTCTSCPITMDYSPARLNIFYDEESEIVEEVRCG